jgi:hypothetical protein
MVLLVVFVPAFSMIFSPPTYTCPASECPACPECPPCPQCPMCPEIPSIAGRLIIFGHYIPIPEDGIVFYEFYLDLMKFDNYKYVIVLPFPRERVSGTILWNPDNLEETWFLTVKYLNSTHSYIEIYESMRYQFEYQTDFRDWDEAFNGRYIHVYIIREDLDPRSVLT